MKRPREGTSLPGASATLERINLYPLTLPTFPISQPLRSAAARAPSYEIPEAAIPGRRGQSETRPQPTLEPVDECRVCGGRGPGRRAVAGERAAGARWGVVGVDLPALHVWRCCRSIRERARSACGGAADPAICNAWGARSEWARPGRRCLDQLAERLRLGERSLVTALAVCDRFEALLGLLEVGVDQPASIGSMSASGSNRASRWATFGTS